MHKEKLNTIEALVGERLSASRPDVELLAVEAPGEERLRIFIDREGGVDLDLCEAVTGLLPDLLEEYSIEVSSPGPERPLARAEHFAAAVGKRVRVRTSEAVDGQRSFTGTLSAAGSETLSISTPSGAVEIPLALVSRANIAPERGEDLRTEVEREVNA